MFVCSLAFTLKKGFAERLHSVRLIIMATSGGTSAAALASASATATGHLNALDVAVTVAVAVAVFFTGAGQFVLCLSTSVRVVGLGFALCLRQDHILVTPPFPHDAYTFTKQQTI